MSFIAKFNVNNDVTIINKAKFNFNIMSLQLL